MNRLVYVGQVVLDLSKHLMYDFWYNNINAKYDNTAQLLYTDTDSLIMEVETPDIYVDMWADKDNYDLSDCPKGHQYHDDMHRKVIGKLKNETCGIPLAEVIALRAKMYSIEKSDLSNIGRAKGVSRTVVKKDFTHELHKCSLLDRKELIHTQVNIRSVAHQIGVYEQNKSLPTR